MKAIHQVITRTATVKRGVPVFAGTRVPVRALLDHLDRGGEVDAFLEKHRTVTRENLNAAMALGLEALLAQVPLDTRSPQGSLLPRLDSSGAIVNADELRGDQVIGRRVLCPSCRRLIFKAWPEGWDSHAERRCRGLARPDPKGRKAEFKARYGHLFRI